MLNNPWKTRMRLKQCVNRTRVWCANWCNYVCEWSIECWRRWMCNQCYVSFADSRNGCIYVGLSTGRGKARIVLCVLLRCVFNVLVTLLIQPDVDIWRLWNRSCFRCSLKLCTESGMTRVHKVELMRSRLWWIELFPSDVGEEREACSASHCWSKEKPRVSSCYWAGSCSRNQAREAIQQRTKGTTSFQRSITMRIVHQNRIFK